MDERNRDTLALVIFVLVMPALVGLFRDHRVQIMALLMQPKAPYFIAGACALSVVAFLWLCVVLALRVPASERGGA